MNGSRNGLINEVILNNRIEKIFNNALLNLLLYYCRVDEENQLK